MYKGFIHTLLDQGFANSEIQMAEKVGCVCSLDSPKMAPYWIGMYDKKERFGR